MTNYHESLDKLTPETQDLSRAIHSLMEELEAVDWYQQRIDAAADPELRAILAHNRDEEKEHAAMVLEWIRRKDPVMDAKLREILFKAGPIVGDHAESPAPPAGSSSEPAPARPAPPALTVGRLGPSDTK